MHNPNKKGIEQLFHKIVFRKKKKYQTAVWGNAFPCSVCEWDPGCFSPSSWYQIVYLSFLRSWGKDRSIPLGVIWPSKQQDPLLDACSQGWSFQDGVSADTIRKTLTESKTRLLKWIRAGPFKLCLKHQQKLGLPSEKQKYCFENTDLWQPFFSPCNKRGQHMLQYNVCAVPVWGYAAQH